ncbi:MAG: lipoate--protein ligase [Spirochaetales bacterium]|nr:lipoate--protein ligase [Spirochaetales bacterium]
MAKTTIIYSNSTNPWFNLTVENWIFSDMDPEGYVLYLWRNSDTVVIGRYQNPWIECRLDKMKEDEVKLARRQSGGGAVYHDVNNLNFTFMCGKGLYDKELFYRIITDSLASFGIEAEVSGRNDILVDGKKVSGSAFKHKTDRSFHHGTLLVNTDMSRLADYLNPDKRKLESKGIKSVRSRVANLIEFNPDITAEKLSEAIRNSFFDKLGAGSEDYYDVDMLENNLLFNSSYKLLSSDKWLYEKSPDFSHCFDSRFSWGGIEINIEVERARISDVKIFTDSLYPEMISQIEQQLQDCKYSFDSIEDILTRIALEQYEWIPCIDDIKALFKSEM